MAKGLLIKTSEDASSGRMRLTKEVESSTCVMEKAGTGKVKLTISLIIKDAEIADHDTEKIDKFQAFILSENEKDITLTSSETLAILEDPIPSSGKMEDLDINFTVRALKSGKVGGPSKVGGPGI